MKDKLFARKKKEMRERGNNKENVRKRYAFGRKPTNLR